MIRSRVTFATIEAAAIAALFVSPSTTALCAGASGPSLKPSTRHASARGVSRRGRSEPPQVRAVEPVAVDVGGRDHAHRHLRRGEEHRLEELLAGLGLDLLRVVEEREGARPVAVQELVVEEDAGDDERAGERAPAGLVRAGDEADAEPAVVAKEPLADGSGHAAEDNGRGGT